ncbi:MAG: leucine-rich repeat protein [Clostridia bacterium]|nr:leucine-rich repeat protein [Clostridia bacterium]
MKFKKTVSLICAGTMLFGFAAAPICQAQAYTIESGQNDEITPDTPAAVAARYAEQRNHVYNWTTADGGGYSFNYDGELIMPGDTFEFPILEANNTVYYIETPFFIGSRDSQDPSYWNIPEDFEITGAIEVTPDGVLTKTYGSGEDSKTMTFNVKWVNNTNCPIILSYKGSGNGPVAGKWNQIHRWPKITFYAPYYNINYYEDDDERYHRRSPLDSYFWRQGNLKDLEFPQYYWLTDTPYTITLPNPVTKSSHYDYWASDDADQLNRGDYTDITVGYVNTYSTGTSHSPASFKSYGEAKISPIFKSGNTITFNGNGGTINGRSEWIAEIPEYDGESGEYGYSLEDYAPVKDGDTFLGWCSAEFARYDTFVTKDDESALYEKYWENDRYNRNSNVTLYAKWASNTREALEKNGWDIDDDGTLWLLNNKGAEAWVEAKRADPTLAEKVKGIKQRFNPDPNNINNDFAYSLSGVFGGCVNLEELTFEKKVNWLNWSEFKDCVNLKTITFMEDAPYSLSNSLTEAPKDLIVNLPEGLEGRLDKYAYLANGEERYGVSVNGVLLTGNNLTVQCGEGTATFDPESNTLTLENAELTRSLTPHWMSQYSDPETYTYYRDAAIISDLDVLNVVLKGRNIVGNLDAFRTNGDLNISGDGTIESYYTLSNYYIIDSETGEQKPVSATFPMTTTIDGNLYLDGVTVTRMDAQPTGDIVVKNSTLVGGVFKAANGKLSINNSTATGFKGGISGTYDKGTDYNPTVGGKFMTIEDTTFDYVVVTAPEDCEDITFRNSNIQLNGKFSAGTNTKLNIISTKFNAYGQSDGVTNIPVENITLDGCKIKQGDWTQRGYFAIDLTAPETTITSGDYRYELNDDGTATIVEYIGKEKIVTFPKELDGKKVTKIGTRVKMGVKPDDFVGYTVIEELTIPDTVTEILPTALFDNPGLKSVTMADSVKIVGGGAFAGCGLEKVKLSKNIDTLVDHTFTECPFTSIEIPEGIRVIEHTAFWRCDKLTEVTIPASVDVVEYTAFEGCSSVTDVTFLNKKTKIDDDAFADREGVTLTPTVHGYIGSTAEEFAKANDLAFIPLDNPTYKIDQGEEINWSSESETNLPLTIKDKNGNKPTGKVTGVTINGKSIDEKSYTVTETDNGIVVSLTIDLIRSLSSGRYLVCASFADGIAKTQLVIDSKENAAGIIGDIDGDASITASDALFILRASVDLEEIPQEKFAIADVDEDNVITSSDALNVLRASVGLSASENIGRAVPGGQAAASSTRT